MTPSETAAAPEAFDAAAYIRENNEKEQARRSGKAAAAPQPVKPAEPAAETKPAAAPHLSRSERRMQNHLREELGAERARREMVEQQLADLRKGAPEGAAKPAVDEDPEPQRRAFTTDAEYTRAVSAWDRRQETQTATQNRERDAANEKQIAALREEIAAADAKAIEDQKLIPDWDEVKAAAQESDDQPEFHSEDHPYLMRLLSTSDVRAFVLHHLALNPDDMRKLLDATGNFEKQFSLFRRLEGRVEKMYSSEKQPEKKEPEKKEAAKPAAETEADRDARKARPSEASAPQGGSAPVSTVSPTLADGRTMNPAWKQQQQDRANARR